jgi:hypothetical protein
MLYHDYERLHFDLDGKHTQQPYQTHYIWTRYADWSQTAKTPTTPRNPV